LVFITAFCSAGRGGMAGPGNAPRAAAALEVTASQSIPVSGCDFGISGPALAAAIPSGKAVSFNVGFRSAVADAHSGTVLIRSDAVTLAVEAPGSGTETSAEIDLAASPDEVNFGTVSVGETKTSAITLKASGNADLEISRFIVSGQGFRVTGAKDGDKLAPGQELTLEATFEPTKTGTAGGSLAIFSNASQSPVQVRFAGSGVANSTTTSSVYLRWDPSTSTGIAGYYVYRSTNQTGVFARLNASPEASTSYTDTSVSAGTTYYYKVTSVDSSEVESSFSDAVSATIP
jgi:hypothetical protein